MIMETLDSGFLISPVICASIATIVGPGDSLISPGIIAKWGGIKGYPVVYTSFAVAICIMLVMMVKSLILPEL